jgi:ABC-type Fe3+ transport system substrate-binding protein
MKWLIALIASAALFALPTYVEHAKAADAALIDAARKEGKVRWYTVILVDEGIGPIVAAFKTRYSGIEVDVTRANAVENARKIIEEDKAGRHEVDVFDGSTTAAPLFTAGLIAPYKAESAADIPDRYKHPDGYWTALLLEFLAPGYNTEMVSAAEAPKSYQDLLDPKWRGKMMWSAGTNLTSGPGFAANVIMVMGERDGVAYLEKLKTQDIIEIKGSGHDVIEALSSRRAPIALQIFNHHTVIEQALGHHVDWIKMEPVLGFSNNIGLVKNAPHPNAGKLLIDFILSPEAQTVIRNANHIPASTKVEAAVPSLKNGFRVNYVSPLDVTERNAAWQATFNKIFR